MVTELIKSGYIRTYTAWNILSPILGGKSPSIATRTWIATFGFLETKPTLTFLRLVMKTRVIWCSLKSYAMNKAPWQVHYLDHTKCFYLNIKSDPFPIQKMVTISNGDLLTHKHYLDNTLIIAQQQHAYLTLHEFLDIGNNFWFTTLMHQKPAFHAIGRNLAHPPLPNGSSR